MNAFRARPRQRLTAAAVALALLLGSAGCASPYHFSQRLDTRLPQTGPDVPGDKLAGDLHLSLAALMDQRRLLWQAAGEAEHMKNATALGLIGLSAAAIYRGARYTDNKGWMQRAGLAGATVWAGATWLEPSARQSIYLQGAVSLTCLALATAPYEMTTKEYETIKDHIAGARMGLEQLATALRLAGRYEKYSETYWLVYGGWNKLRWANRVLDSADVAMGNLEQAGPRLRDMTALLTSDVATQVKNVSKDLSELPAAITSLKPSVAKLLGADVFAPPPKGDDDKPPPEPPRAPPDPGTNAPKPASAPQDPQCGAGTPAPVNPALAKLGKQVEIAAAAASGAAQAATAAASAASAAANDPAKKARNTPKSTPAEVAQARVAAQAAVAASAAEARKKEVEAERQRFAKENAEKMDIAHAKELRESLGKATNKLDEHLGAVASFVKRIAAARNGLELPKGCGAATPVRLVPDKRELLLQAGESFQFVLEGDSGKAAASYLGPSLPPEVLDITMPLVQATTAVRLSAGTAATRVVSTVVRVSDSKREQNFDITVKVCPAHE
jgi:hypothetical protein